MKRIGRVRLTNIRRVIDTTVSSVLLMKIGTMWLLRLATVAVFNRYVAATEARFANELRPGGPFLHVDALSSDAQKTAYDQLKRGDILVEKLQTKVQGKDSDVPDGIIHHWVGLAFIPSTTLAKVIPAVQDYGHRDEL